MDAGWMARAACRGLPLERFIPPGDADLDDREEWQPPPEVLAVCEPCPVLAECLDAALRDDAWGYWAATSRHQRRQLRRPRRRLACPVCNSEVTVVLAGTQVCLACGRSWKATAAGQPAGRG